MSSGTTTTTEPEQYPVRPTPHCPNSVFPVLVYRGVLPTPGTWGAITTKHFHPNTHECYGVIHGRSELVFGLGGADAVLDGTDDDDDGDDGNDNNNNRRSSNGRSIDQGVRVTVAAGDVVVVPAGVAHASVRRDAGYKYIGVYPEGSPKWRNEWGKTALRGADDPLFDEIKGVPVPACDPVFGADGPLKRVWNGVLAR
ncbi:cupin domain protein [Diplodia corticola]|uniref:Cupin domain protein n=1 Tax=Diplodia corticola TaxID=236234 RepID=A0A1J9SBA7_9PEZI|nr:cupin domain protein [Diplodia corticola]OJD36869.1 cupin domain protein [Diplodia corticola]